MALDLSSKLEQEFVSNVIRMKKPGLINSPVVAIAARHKMWDEVMYLIDQRVKTYSFHLGYNSAQWAIAGENYEIAYYCIQADYLHYKNDWKNLFEFARKYDNKALGYLFTKMPEFQEWCIKNAPKTVIPGRVLVGNQYAFSSIGFERVVYPNEVESNKPVIIYFNPEPIILKEVQQSSEYDTVINKK